MRVPVDVSNVVRPLVVGVCPHCAGQGEIPEAPESAVMVKCHRCDGHGDLYDFKLIEAYELGRRDVLDSLSYLGVEFAAAMAAAMDAPRVDVKALKVRVGG